MNVWIWTGFRAKLNSVIQRKEGCIFAPSALCLFSFYCSIFLEIAREKVISGFLDTLRFQNVQSTCPASLLYRGRKCFQFHVSLLCFRWIKINFCHNTIPHVYLGWMLQDVYRWSPMILLSCQGIFLQCFLCYRISLLFGAQGCV